MILHFCVLVWVNGSFTSLLHPCFIITGRRSPSFVVIASVFRQVTFYGQGECILLGYLYFFKSKPFVIITFGCLEKALYFFWKTAYGVCDWGEHFVLVRKKQSKFCFNKLNLFLPQWYQEQFWMLTLGTCLVKPWRLNIRLYFFLKQWINLKKKTATKKKQKSFFSLDDGQEDWIQQDKKC